jgi:hypothetical protein
MRLLALHLPEAASMNIMLRRRRTSEGYALWIVCEICGREVRRVDAQEPVWAVVVALGEHETLEHTPARSDDAVGVVRYRHPNRAVETLELPE